MPLRVSAGWSSGLLGETVSTRPRGRPPLFPLPAFLRHFIRPRTTLANMTPS